MSRWKLRAVALVCVAVGLLAGAPPGHAKDAWPSIDRQELAMKDNPLNPGAPAMILYREMISDYGDKTETNYYRIKVFTDAGRKYADVEILYPKGIYQVTDIQARTIHADGTVANFTQAPFDKVVQKTRRLSYQAKTFTLPNVQVGSILEYRYTIRWAEEFIPQPPRWIVQQDLFTRKARFYVKPARTNRPEATKFAVRSSALNEYYVFQQNLCGKETSTEKTSYGIQGVAFLPRAGYSSPQSGKDGVVQLNVESVPPSQAEEYMPPEDEFKARVLFYYTTKAESFEEYWKRTGVECNFVVEEFLRKRAGIPEAVAALVNPADSPENNLRKLYSRAQQVRNLTFEAGSEADWKRGNLKRNVGAEDALARGYGSQYDVTRLFVALARAAGFEAAVVRIAERDRAFFHFELLDWTQLSGEVALVSRGDQRWWLDPGTPFCPFGLLSWEKTGVHGLQLGQDGGAFVQTPQFNATYALSEHKADLKLDAEGTLRGSVKLTFTGEAALEHRLDGMDTDEAGRRKAMEEITKAMLPTTAQVTITAMDGWSKSEGPLVVQASIEVPGFATSTGRRLLLPLALFQSNKRHPFSSAQRTNPVYFRYPFQVRDEVDLELPAGMKVESLPAPRMAVAEFGSYQVTRDKQANHVRLHRNLVIGAAMLTPNYYPDLRGFYDKVTAGDSDQVVVQHVPAGE